MNISVTIPVFNAETYVEQAAESALVQPETAEVLLIEDGSRDDSLAVCEKLNARHERVRLLRHPGGVNLGVSASTNLGIREARSDYIAFLDSDDYYLPGRFTKTREILDKFPHVDGVYEATGMHFESEKAEEDWDSSPLFRHHGRITTMKEPVAPDKLFAALIIGNLGIFHTNAFVVRRSLFERTGFFDESLKFHQDTAMRIKMAAVGNLMAGRIQEPVAMRRVHGDNTILKLGAGYNPHLEQLDDILLEWGRDRRLSRSHMRLLSYKRWLDRVFGFDNGLRSRFYDIKVNGLPGVRLAQMVAFLLSRFARNPSLIVSSNFLFLIWTQVTKLVDRFSGTQ